MNRSFLPVYRRAANVALHGFLVWWVLDRTVRWWLIRRFFQQAPSPAHDPRAPAGAITVVQPILSGDPHLAGTLRANATLATSLRVRWKWLVDHDDLPGQQLTAALLDELAATAPAARQRIECRLTPPAPDGVNPKTYKLHLAWENRLPSEQSAFFGVLDDDTRLLPGQLEAAAAALQSGKNVGLAFGLPYYRSFGTPWAALVSTFVNRNSLWSYLPILRIMAPPTINGMFWLARPEAIAALRGFRAVEEFVCDDYALARALRGVGYELRQTAIVHPLQTGVENASAYDRLITRWFIFPLVSLLRHEPWRRLAWFQALVFLPTFQLLGALVLASLAGGSVGKFTAVFAAQVWREGLQIHLEANYLPGAVGRGRDFVRRRALGWLVDLLLPFQVIRAFLAPRVIDWRGHHLRLDPDGRFVYLKRRGDL